MIETVAISDCVHFRGFRYGGFGNNIYEDYIVGLHGGVETRHLRMQFIERVLSLQSNTWGAALNIAMDRDWNAWDYPWKLRTGVSPSASNAQENPDIICHYSPEGVLASHLNREFHWLARAYQDMKHGYLPERYGYVRLLALKKEGARRFIVIDGNHRISAMHALGHTHLSGECSRVGLRDARYSCIWPAVLTGRFSRADALRIFNRYFENDNRDFLGTITRTVLYDEPLDLDDADAN